MSVQRICGVILTSDNVERLADYYSTLLGIRLAREEHGDLAVHYGADLGTIHFAIHPPSDFREERSGYPSTKIAFQVNDLASHVSRMRAAGHEPWQDVHDEGFGPLASFRDPDGNLIELVELRYEFQPATDL